VVAETAATAARVSRLAAEELAAARAEVKAAAAVEIKALRGSSVSSSASADGSTDVELKLAREAAGGRVAQ
jgi:hypothetical protein